MRREMQEIVPGLWLGPFAMAKKKDLLQDAGITHIICIRDASEAHIVRPFFPNEFVYKELWVFCFFYYYSLGYKDLLTHCSFY